MTPEIVAKAIIQNEHGQVLLLRRVETDDQRPGEWDFPGGGVEEGEELRTGVIREIQEEAGLVVDEVTLVYAATEPKSAHKSTTRLLFIGKTLVSAVTLSAEHDEYQWVDVETALREFPHPFYSRGLAYARDHGLLVVKP